MLVDLGCIYFVGRCFRVDVVGWFGSPGRLHVGGCDVLWLYLGGG